MTPPWPALLALVSAFGFALASVLMRRALEHTAPLTATVVSVTCTAAMLWALAGLTVPLGRALVPEIVPFAVAGLVAPGLGRLWLFSGVARLGVARSAALVSTTPLVAVLLAVAVLGERPSRLLLAGAAAIVVGGVLLSTRSGGDRAWRRRDLVFPLLAALAFGARDVVSRWGLRLYGEPLLAAAVAAATSVGVVALVGAARRVELRVPRAALGLVAASGLSEGIAYLTMWWALAQAHVSLVSPLVNTHPIFALALATALLRDLERVTWRVAVGAALIVGGVFVVVRVGG